MAVEATATPLPLRHGRLVRKLFYCYGLETLPRVKFVQTKHLALNSSKQKTCKGLKRATPLARFPKERSIFSVAKRVG
jgi:hypothetical protein